MGWGTPEHEGIADEKRPDGSWSGGTRRGGDPDAVAVQAACSCGWRSEREHPVSPRPADVERDERGIPHGSAWDGWVAIVERAENACYDDWNAEHFEPLLGYEPHEHLVLGRDGGGARHFLDGRPVHAGTVLELRLPGGRWLRGRYEWSQFQGGAPTFHMRLGGPVEAERQDVVPKVQFELPPRAALRWPAEPERTR